MTDPAHAAEDDAPAVDAAAAIAAGTMIRQYELIRQIGRGGMAVIYRIWDRKLRRNLALKVVRPDAGLGSDMDGSALSHQKISRFPQEAQITSQLDHPGVVPVYGVGQSADGRAFFTMQLVRGKPFREILEEGPSKDSPWTRERNLNVLLNVCETMAFCHSKGVVHRDLKPDNIMLGAFGEVLVLDWGIAKVLGEPAAAPDTDPVVTVRSRDASTWTRVGVVSGTPAWMGTSAIVNRAVARPCASSCPIESINGGRLGFVKLCSV